MVRDSMQKWLSLLGLAGLLVLAAACGRAQSPTPPPDLPLEKLVIEPGERLRLKIPPDQNARPEESQPQASIEFVVTDAMGQPIRANVAVDGRTSHRHVAQFLLVMPDPSKPTIINVSAPGFETWEMGLRFGLKHTRRFQFPITLQSKAD